jgi:glycosyltransferase involved in cell wall biosynthesis
MQHILFVSAEPPVDPLPTIDSHYAWVPVHGPLSFARLSEIWHDTSPLAVYTWGPTSPQWAALSVTYEVRKRWVHLGTGPLPKSLDVTATVFTSVLDTDRDLRDHQPLMSVITTTFRSGEKILRPFRSLQNQSFTNWEWIVWDDSPVGDDATYTRLLELQRQDLRIQVYRAPRPSGIIGQMKRRAAGLARGEYIVEVDHDDDLHPDLLRWIADAGKTHPDAGFFYTDCCELTEDTYESVSYGDHFGLGYSGHYRVWSPLHDRFVIAAAPSPPNPRTITHIVSVPNHVRAWRTSFYDRVGKHNPFLAVGDDYELLVRCYLQDKNYGAAWCHIRACGYYQYRNRDGNFTFIRNSLIQHIVAHTRHFYKSQLPAPHPTSGHEPIWRDIRPMDPANRVAAEQQRSGSAASDCAVTDGSRVRDSTDPEPRTHVEYDPHPRPQTVVLLSAADLPAAAAAHPETRLVVMDSLTDAQQADLRGQPAVRDRLLWWSLSSTDPADRLRFARKILHWTPDFVVWGPTLTVSEM